jgi:hypothetical protein
VDPRSFQAASQITGEEYQVQFRWLQTAISLRHSDTVDVKFLVNGSGKIVALPHGALEEACRRAGVPLTDELCIGVAAGYLRRALENGDALGQDLLAIPPAELGDLAQQQRKRRDGA